MKLFLKGDLGMRLYNIYYICKAALPDLNLSVERYNNGSRKIINWASYKKTLQVLFNIDFIKKDVLAAFEVLDPIDREQLTPQIGTDTYNELVKKNDLILTKVTTVIDLYKSMKNGTSKPGIDIKIPPCNSLKDYIKILDDIDFILTQCPYLKNENEEIKYKGTDVGSDWITFAIVISGAVSTGFVILNNLASLMHKAISLMSNKKILDMQEETYKTMQLKNEITQETIDAFKRMKEITYKKYVDELQNELGKLDDGEEEGRVSKSLEKLANLIDKGVEIQTSIETPKEIKVLFPFVDAQQVLPDTLLKYIEDKTPKKDNK